MRSDVANQYRKLYKKPAWRMARLHQLTAHPLCERHLQRGMVVPANVVHHRKPHRGDWNLFVDPSNLESLCQPCHDVIGGAEDRHGFSSEVGRDGIPTDPLHPFLR